jgi:hypothetical protein
LAVVGAVVDVLMVVVVVELVVAKVEQMVLVLLQHQDLVEHLEILELVVDLLQQEVELVVVVPEAVPVVVVVV